MKQRAIRTWRYCWQCVSYTFSVALYLMGLFVLALWLMPEFRPRKRTTSIPRQRTLPIPVREGGKIYAVMPDNSRVEVGILSAASHARAWTDAVTGVAVWEQMKIRPEELERAKQPVASSTDG